MLVPICTQTQKEDSTQHKIFRRVIISSLKYHASSYILIMLNCAASP